VNRAAGGGPGETDWARYGQIGILLVTPMCLLGFAGHWLDRRLGTTPWLLLAGLILGMAAGFVGFLRTVLPPKGGGPGTGSGGRGAGRT
jgi:F0F1-type ATP synthase assembly protein I